MARKLRKTFSYDVESFLQRGPRGPRLVIFHAPVGEILKWAEVGELGLAKQSGPQRARKEARVEAIRKFLTSSPSNTIPTAVVLAFPGDRAKFEAGVKGKGTLFLVDDGKASAAIVDGQHRLYGMDAFDPNCETAVVGILNADRVERAFQFLVINNKASRVPANHTKALLANMSKTSLPDRLRGARLAFDAEGIRDVDLINSEEDSPFFQSIDWPATPAKTRMVPATAIELSLDYLEGLGLPEYEDRDTRRSVFMSIWRTVRSEWSALWKVDSRLLSKVGIVTLTRFIADLITSWADNEDLDIEVSDLAEIETQTSKILKYMDRRFWTTPWAERAQGGFDTSQGRERVLNALQQLYRNGRRKVPWHTDIEIVERSAE